MLRLYDRSGASGDSWDAIAPDLLFTLLRASVPADGDALAAWTSLEWPVRLYLADDAASAREPLRPALIPRENGYDEVVELSDAFMALESAVGVAWNASKPKPGDSAWSYEYDDEDAQDWDAPYDPRRRRPAATATSSRTTPTTARATSSASTSPRRTPWLRGRARTFWRGSS